MGGEDFETDNPCDVLKLEELKAKVCFVSEDVDKDNARMGEWVHGGQRLYGEDERPPRRQ